MEAQTKASMGMKGKETWVHELAKWRCYYAGLAFCYASWLVGYLVSQRPPDSPLLGPTFGAVEAALQGVLAHVPATVLLMAAFALGSGVHWLQVRGLCPCQLVFNWAESHLFSRADRRRRQLMPFSPYIDELMFQEHTQVRESTLFRRLDDWAHKKLGASGSDALKALIDKLYVPPSPLPSTLSLSLSLSEKRPMTTLPKDAAASWKHSTATRGSTQTDSGW